jgi:hypothetical protein
MAIFSKKQQAPAKQTHREIRKLGGALQKTVKTLDNAYPSADKTSRIEQQFARTLAAATGRKDLTPKQLRLLRSMQLVEEANIRLQNLADIAASRNAPWAIELYDSMSYYKRLLEEKIAKEAPQTPIAAMLKQCRAAIEVYRHTPQSLLGPSDHAEIEKLYQQKAELERLVRKSILR